MRNLSFLAAVLLLCGPAHAAITVDWNADTLGLGTGLDVGGNNWNAVGQHNAFRDHGSNAAFHPQVITLSDVNAQAFVGASQTVRFDGDNDFAEANTWQSGYGGADRANARFSIWFSPDALDGTSGRQTLFESGGNVDGFGVVIDANDVMYLLMNNRSIPGTANDITQRTAGIDLQTFVSSHGFVPGQDYLRATAEIKMGFGNRMTLRVEDQFANIVTDSLGFTNQLVDWAGGDEAGLGNVDSGENNNNGLGGSFGTLSGVAGTGTFRALHGNIARFQYESFVLPEPSSVALILVGFGGITAMRRKRLQAPAQPMNPVETSEV